MRPASDLFLDFSVRMCAVRRSLRIDRLSSPHRTTLGLEPRPEAFQLFAVEGRAAEKDVVLSSAPRLSLLRKFSDLVLMRDSADRLANTEACGRREVGNMPFHQEVFRARSDRGLSRYDLCDFNA